MLISNINLIVQRILYKYVERMYRLKCKSIFILKLIIITNVKSNDPYKNQTYSFNLHFNEFISKSMVYPDIYDSKRKHTLK